MSKKKNPLVLNRTELEKKGTKELLGYLRRLHQCEESFEKSDLDVNPCLEDVSRIYFKQTIKWEKTYLDVKSILDKRENIE